MNSKEFIDFFVEQLSDSSNEIDFETKFRSLSDWDSLTAMLLITNLKDDHGIDISISDLQKCETVNDIFNLIKLK